MPFVFLLLFALLSLQTKWPEPPPGLDAAGSLLLAVGLLVGSWLVAGWRTALLCRQLDREPLQYACLWQRFSRFRRKHLTALAACYLIILFGLGWGHAARQLSDASGLIALSELIQFAPLLGAALLAWERFYRFERDAHRLTDAGEPFLGRFGYVAMQARQNLLLVVPPLVLYCAVHAVLVAFPWVEEYDGLLVVAGAVLLALALLSVPLILKVFLGLKPLPPGPLRDRLEKAAVRLGFRFNNVLVWDTRRSVANAMVSGVVPWVRYVVLTDLMIERLTPDEIEAVFAHEVGHIKHHHMTLYVLFFLGSLVILSGLWKIGELNLRDLAFDLPARDAWAEALPVFAGPGLLLLVSAYVFLVFGYLSRRCESQADLFGCRAVSSQAFIGALEKVADLNGIPRHRTSWLASWQHPTIAQRVAFIEQLRDDPALELRFQRVLGALKWGVLLAVGTGLALVGWALGPEQVWELFRLR